MPNISITEIIIIICVYLSSSIPWAVLIGRIRLKDDIRNYGDNNPGTVNVFRAGGIFWGFVSIIAKENFLPLNFSLFFLFFKLKQILLNTEIVVSIPTIPPPIDI